MSSIRQDIVDALVVRLKTLRTANGYSSNAGLTVYSWHPENLQLETIPALVINDIGDTLTPSGRDQIEHTLRIEIHGFIAAGETTDRACRELLRDIIVAVLDPEDRTLGGVCDAVQATDGGNIQIEQQTDKTVGSVTLALSVNYRTDRGDWSVKI